MKIHKDDIDAVFEYLNSSGYFVPESAIRIAIHAMLQARRARKHAKRERQRKEKDKQVGESVKPADFNSQQVNTFVNPFEALKPSNVERAKNFLRSSQLNAVMSTPSKAPEWDGTFVDKGEYETNCGLKAIVEEAKSNFLFGRVGDMPMTWHLNGKHYHAFPSVDLIRPWPKGEQ